MSGEKNPAYRGVFHVKCLNCDNDISGAKWEAKNRKFCSVECRHQYYSGDNHPSKRPEVKEKQRKARLSQIQIMGGDLQLGRNEKNVLDELEKILGYEIIRDFQIVGFKPDGYIRDINVVVEIDEKHHFNKNGEYCEKDIIRQTIIENELGCSFLRIKDNGNLSKKDLVEIINSSRFL